MLLAIEDSFTGAIVEADVPPAVAEVLAAPEPRLREVPYTDTRPRRAPADAPGGIDPDAIDADTYTVPAEAALMRAVEDRLLWWFRDSQARPVEVLVGYRKGGPSEAGAIPREVVVTPARLARDAARLRRWKSRPRRDGWAGPEKKLAERPRATATGAALAGGTGPVTARRAGRGTP